MDFFDREESKAEAAAALSNSSQVALAALATGSTMAQTRRRLLAHIAGADASAPADADNIAGSSPNDSAGTSGLGVSVGARSGSAGVSAADSTSREGNALDRAADHLPLPVTASRIVVSIRNPARPRQLGPSSISGAAADAGQSAGPSGPSTRPNE